MNSKLAKLRAELDKNTEKIQKLQERNEVLRRQIQETEDAEIVDIVRTYSMTPEQLAQLIQSARLPGKEEPPHEA